MKTELGAAQAACESIYGSSKGQGATEYLVLIAVVLIVALVSVSLLGFFPGISADSQIKQSQAYWSGEARPFQVVDAASTYGTICGNGGSGGYVLSVQNTEASTLKITNISADGSTGYCGPDGVQNAQVSLGPGERKLLSVVTSAGSSPCTAGTSVQMGLNFTYSSPYIANKTQLGTKKLVLRCSTPAVAACTADGQSCDGPSQCCSGLVCSDDSGYCQSSCLDDGQIFCTTDGDCCTGTCVDSTCTSACVAIGRLCDPRGMPACCAGLTCRFGHGIYSCAT